MKEHYKFKLKPLPYGYSELEPYISEQTMKVHHMRHLGGYINSLNELISKNPRLSEYTLTELYCANYKSSKLGESMRFLSGAVYNHNLYFAMLCPSYNDAITCPSGALMDAIACMFGSFEKFICEFKAQAMSLRGSGWVYLCKDKASKPRIVSLPNHARPDPFTFSSILPLDMWEHAYYLDNLERKGEYIDSYFRIINWKLASMLWESKIIY